MKTLHEVPAGARLPAGFSESDACGPHALATVTGEPMHRFVRIKRAPSGMYPDDVLSYLTGAGFTCTRVQLGRMRWNEKTETGRTVTPRWGALAGRIAKQGLRGVAFVRTPYQRGFHFVAFDGLCVSDHLYPRATWLFDTIYAKAHVWWLIIIRNGLDRRSET